MKEIIRILDALVMTIVILIIPILCAISNCYNWNENIRTLLMMLLVIDFGAVSFVIKDFVERDRK